MYPDVHLVRNSIHSQKGVQSLSCGRVLRFNKVYARIIGELWDLIIIVIIIIMIVNNINNNKIIMKMVTKQKYFI